MGALGAAGGVVLQSVSDQVVEELRDLLRRARNRRARTDATATATTAVEPQAPEVDALRADDPEGLTRTLREIAGVAAQDQSVWLLFQQFLRKQGALRPERLAEPQLFLNHEQLLLRAQDLLTAARADAPDAAHTLLLHGPAGVGTSTVACRLARELVAAYPGNHLHVDLGGEDPRSAATAGTALTQLLLATGLVESAVPRDDAAKRQYLRRLLGDTRPLLVLDNVHSAAQLRAVHPLVAGSATLVTGGEAVARGLPDVGLVLPVEPLPEEHAWELLRRLSGVEPNATDTRLRSVVRAGRPGQLCEVARALRATGGAVRPRRTGMVPGAEWAVWERTSVSAPEASTASRGARMDDAASDGLASGSSAAGGGEDEGVRDTLRLLDATYRTLSPAAQRLHAWLGRVPHAVLGCGMPANPLAHLLDVDEAEAAGICAELTEVGLLHTVGDGRYRQPPHARRHAATVSEPPPGWALLRLLESYRALAVDADRRVMQGRWVLGRYYAGLVRRAVPQVHPNVRDALEALRTERPALVESVVLAVDSGFLSLAVELCEAMWGLHLRLGFHDDLLRTHTHVLDAVLDRHGTPRLDDAPAVARVCVQRGFAHRALGEDARAEADFDRALELEPADHPRGCATAVESVGLLRLDQAQRAETGERHIEAQERYAEARERFEAASRYAREAGERRAGALLLHHDARALAGLGRTRETLEALDASLAALRDLPALPPPGDLYNRGKVLVTLGRTRLGAAQPDAAVGPLSEALDLFYDEGALAEEAQAAELLAGCVPELGRQRALLQRSLRLQEALGGLDAADRLSGLLQERSGG